MWVSKNKYVYIHANYICRRMYMDMYMCIRMYVYIYARICICIKVRVYVCVYVPARAAARTGPASAALSAMARSVRSQDHVAGLLA